MFGINKNFYTPSGFLDCGPKAERSSIQETKSKGILRQYEDISFLMDHPDANAARIIYNANIDKTKLDLKEGGKITASRVVQGDNIDRYQGLLNTFGFEENKIEIGVSKPSSIARIEGLDALGTKEQVRVQRALIDLEMKNKKNPITPSEYDTIKVSEDGNEILLTSYSKKALLDLQTGQRIMCKNNPCGDDEVIYFNEDEI